MSKNENPPVDAEDVYTLLVDVHKLLIEQKETLDQLRELLSKVPEAMDALGSNPMFKPFAKMLGLNN
jgi:hypothetical protein